MDKRGIVTLLILSLFLVSCTSGCAPADNVACNSSYIKVGNECCLDKNNNSICDKDEVQENKSLNNISAEEHEYTLECLTNCNRGIQILSQRTENKNFIATFKNDNERGCNMTCISTYSGALAIYVPVQESVESNFSFDNAVKNMLLCSDDWTRDNFECDTAISQTFEAK